MMTNNDFLEVIKESFSAYLQIGTSRSTKKLKTLHGHIATDLKEKFGSDFTVRSQGYENDKEGTIDGRYYQKKADITIEKGGKAVAGYAVKFVLRNYSQNSNNYFENMLGETANIRSNFIPYFQIFIIFDKVPYYKNSGKFKKYDTVTPHNLDKYLALSKDDPSVFFHTPDKTLIVLIKLKEKVLDYIFTDDKDYASYYQSVINDEDLLTYANQKGDSFEDSVIYNDYSDFINRTYYITLGRLKNTN
jgi:hypothetical protein